MAKGGYSGIGGKAHKIKKMYTGIAGKARKLKKFYVGIGGKARLWWSGSGLGEGFAFTNGAFTINIYDLQSSSLLKSLPVTGIDSVNAFGLGVASIPSSRLFLAARTYPWFYYHEADPASGAAKHTITIRCGATSVKTDGANGGAGLSNGALLLWMRPSSTDYYGSLIDPNSGGEIKRSEKSGFFTSNGNMHDNYVNNLNYFRESEAINLTNATIRRLSSYNTLEGSNYIYLIDWSYIGEDDLVSNTQDDHTPQGNDPYKVLEYASLAVKYTSSITKTAVRNNHGSIVYS